MFRTNVTMLAVLVFFGAGLAQGQAVISGVSGIVYDGGAVIITGSGFGNKSQAGPILFDNFQDGSPGDPLGSGDESRWVVWSIPEGPDYWPRYSDSFPRHDNDISCMQTLGLRLDRYQSHCRMDLQDAQLAEVYFSGWVYLNYPASGSDVDPNYFTVVQHSAAGLQTSSGYKSYPTQGPGGGQIFSSPCAGSVERVVEWGCGLTGTGAWHRVEFWHGFAGDGDQEVLNLNLDGQCSLALERENAGCDLALVSLLPSFNDPTHLAAMDFHWSEVYVDNTRMRVEMGNAPQFEDCSHREIQVLEDWSDDAVVVRVNLGSFRVDDYVYLFVVDGEGTPSDGYVVQLFENGDLPGPPVVKPMKDTIEMEDL